MFSAHHSTEALTSPAISLAFVLNARGARSISAALRVMFVHFIFLKNRYVKLTSSSQLIARITADDVAHSRSFSTETRPTASKAAASPAVRHFNTSRTLKAVNDSSTMDFAYLPEILGPEDLGAAPMRVPILPDVNFNQSNAPIATEEAVVMLPQISTMVSPRSL